MVYDENLTFSSSGPSYLTVVDWGNFNHKRSVAASLVKGVYTMEHDRRHERRGPDALAPPWWELFNFELVQILVETTKKKGDSIFGAVFKLKSSPRHQTGEAPQYVIAFRGTILKPENWKEDVKLNFRLALNRIHNSNRFSTGLEAASQRIHYQNVWLAGHSQGSSLALAVGREIVKKFDVRFETYLFNPPFVSLPIDWIKSEKVKHRLRATSSVVTGCLAAVVADTDKTDPFVVLATWVPHLFINRADPICSEYAGYFERNMEAIGAGRIVSPATKNSIVSILSSREALHLLPCAHLTLNVTPAPRFREIRGFRKKYFRFKEAHGIGQWWRHDLDLESKHYDMVLAQHHVDTTIQTDHVEQTNPQVGPTEEDRPKRRRSRPAGFKDHTSQFPIPIS